MLYLGDMEGSKGKGSLLHDFDNSSSKKRSKNNLLKGPGILFVVLALLGVGTGYIMAQAAGPRTVNVAPNAGTEGQGEEIEKGAIFGSDDEEAFSDEAEGTLREGGIEGEGAFHLERPGGESQNVYMTSTVIDLSAFVGKKVKVWGKTFEGEKAGWLMDVGRLQVL